MSREYGLPLDPDAGIADLSVGERQRVEIVRCLLQEPRLIIMDEPTSVLTPQEADLLFVTLRRLSSEGVAILYITHRLSEVLALAEPRDHPAARQARRDGRPEGGERQEPGAHDGRQRRWSASSGRAAPQRPTPRLELQKLSLPTDSPFATALAEIDLTVHAGEMVGIAGVAGNGQQEFFDAVSGERRLARRDDASRRRTPHRPARRQRPPPRRRGLRAGGADRPRRGPRLPPLGERRADPPRHRSRSCAASSSTARAAREIEERVGERFDVRRSGPDPKASALSGGNLQKFVVGREIDRAPGILVVNQPTWGLAAARGWSRWNKSRLERGDVHRRSTNL